MEKNNACYPLTPPECPVSPLANYVLTAQIIANNAPADGVSINAVRFTLSSPASLPVAHQELEFSITGSAALVIPTSYTNNNGVVDVVARNTQPETVQLFASLAADETVSANSLLKFTPLAGYQITSEILVNHAGADGISTNQVRFHLTYGGVGVAAQLRLNITGRLTQLVSTDGNGYYTASFSSTTDGNFTVTAELYTDSMILASETVSFTPATTYPRYLGSARVLVATPLYSYAIGIPAFLGSFNIIAGHKYRIEDIPPSLGNTGDCSLGYVLNYADQFCDRTLQNDFLHTAEPNMTPVFALRSGLGKNLNSTRYFSINYGVDFVVRVYDDGPF